MSTIIDDPTVPFPSDDDGSGDGGSGDGSDGSGGHNGGTGPEGAPRPTRSLRRSTDDRVLAGVAGGLGRYFGVDPILFRVLFAVSAFFGGLGVLAYLVGWALVPEEGAVEPPVDRLVDELRRRGVAFWVVVGVLSVMFWVAVIPSWQPLGFGPIAVAVVIVAVALSQRSSARAAAPTGGATGPGVAAGGAAAGAHPTAAVPTADDQTADVPTEATPLTGGAWAAAPAVDPTVPAYTVQDPTQAFGPPPEPTDVRRWEAQARVMAARTAARESQRAARQERRRRMAPARWGSFGLLVVALATVAVLDAADGVPLATYGWVMVGVGLVSLVVGGLFRRTPWLNVLWVLVGLSIILAFGTTPASLADGSGDRLLVPRSGEALPDDVRMAFGRTTVDLTELPAGAGRGRTMEIRQGAGAIVIRVPEGMRVAIHAGVHLGAVIVDEVDQVGGGGDAGRQFDEGPSGPNVLTIDATLAVGGIEIDHVSAGEARAGDTGGSERRSDPTTSPDPTTAPDPTTPPVPGTR